MRYMDAHLHMEGLINSSLRQMSISGIRTIINMVAVPEIVPTADAADFDPEVIFSHVDRVLDFYAWTAWEHFMIKTYSCVGVSMVGVPKRYSEALVRLKEYLVERPEIVGIGEIGLEPASATCPDMKIQEEVLEYQLALADEFHKTVCFHTPLKDKAKWFDRYVPMIENAGLPAEKIVIDHCDGTVLDKVTRMGYYAAVTVQPHRGVRTVDAAAFLMQGDTDRMIVDSDTALLNESDPLAVARTALELKKAGITDDVIKKLLWENPHKAYGITPDDAV